MKKRRLIIATICFCVLLAYLGLSPLIIFLAKKQLGHVFKDSEVVIKGCRVYPLNRLMLLDIEIKNGRAYSLQFKEAGFIYNLSSILRGSILNFYLKEGEVNVNLPQKNITELIQYLNLGSGHSLSVDSLEINKLHLNVFTKGVLFNTTLAFRMNLSKHLIDYMDIGAESFTFDKMELTNGRLKAAQGESAGSLDIAQIKYDKARLSVLKGKAVLKGADLFIEGLNAEFIDGVLHGNLNFKMDKDAGYAVNLWLVNLDIKRFIDDFNLQDKFEMTGKLSGNLSVEGRGADIRVLSGSFSNQGAGGILVIKDTKFMEDAALAAHQPKDLFVESFKNYSYNSALIKLGLEDKNIIFKAELDGQAGKRSLNIVLHDFKLGGE